MHHLLPLHLHQAHFRPAHPVFHLLVPQVVLALLVPLVLFPQVVVLLVFHRLHQVHHLALLVAVAVSQAVVVLASLVLAQVHLFPVRHLAVRLAHLLAVALSLVAAALLMLVEHCKIILIQMMMIILGPAPIMVNGQHLQQALLIQFVQSG